MINSRRRGRVIIPHHLINENPELVAKLFQVSIPVAAFNTPDDEIVYTLISPEFLELPMGASYPLYQVDIKRDPTTGEPELTFRLYPESVRRKDDDKPSKE